MELTWWAVVIAGCVGLAGGITAVLVAPMDSGRRRFRILANVERLTRLPEYRRAVRLRTVSAVVAIVLLLVLFGASVVVAARPTGLPSTAREYSGGQPEDIMLCIDRQQTEPAVATALRYFADRVKTFTTERIGLTYPDRRVVPMTRDYHYAAGALNIAAANGAAANGWVPAVSYVDYAGGVEDVLAMCLTGFPSFEEPAAQRRSLIYVGSGSRAGGETRPGLFTADAVRDLAASAGVQINGVITEPDSPVLETLAEATGGRALPSNADVSAQLTEIRTNPPPPSAGTDGTVTVRPTETPDIPLLLALTALAGLVLWPLVVRR